jgi:predicted alpha/beta-fold hydrolase
VALTADARGEAHAVMQALEHHRAPLWLPGGHAQTIVPALVGRHLGVQAKAKPPTYRRERWTTPDGDFIHTDFLDVAPDAPWLMLFHGLEGSSHSHYAMAFARTAQAAGVNIALPHFRGCSGEPNLAPRAYHSGDFEEIGWMLQRLRERAAAPLMAAGVSLGGNALLRYVEEAGASASAVVASVAAIGSPIDLTAAGHAIGRGLNRLIYTPMFLRTMKPRALAKLRQHPGLFDADRLQAARTLAEFDDVFTGPLHGFTGVEDYWRRGSAKPHLARIRVPALVVNARNDPFVPAPSLPAPGRLGSHTLLWQPPHGGHVGFAAGPPPGHVMTMPQAVLHWLQRPVL